tara:strand:- start:447 stop:3842 length:3396 start_codon:yes stop_codon:yes gene_type:complete
MDLSKKVFGANVDKTIRDYFKFLQEGTFEIQPGDPVQKKSIGVSFDSETYLGDRTPYARMWTAVNAYEAKYNSEDKKYERIEAGKVNIYTINENLNDSYNELDSVSNQKYQPELQDNPYFKPTSGITSVNSKSEGAVGALRRTTVNFTVHNKHDFDNIFLPFFLKPGATVFVDFGWSDKALTLYNPNDKVSNKNLNMANFYESIYPDKDGIKKGFTTTVSGQVTKYDVNVDEKGSFNCSLEFVSSNYSLLDKTISDDNNLKFIFDNSIEELLMGYFLAFSGIQIDVDALIAGNNRLTAKQRKSLVKDFFDDDERRYQQGIDQSLGMIDLISRKSGIYYQNVIHGDSEEDKLGDKEAVYISYGLFEDKFLNQFISFWQYFDDEGNDTTKIEEKTNPFANSFSSKDSWARFDADLLSLQKQKFYSDDDRLSFLYPETWNDTYNKLKPTGWEDAGGVDNDIEKRRIPLRDLFISVPTISEAFKKSQNVNDALEFIFDQIYEDSGNIINIKMISNNDAQVSLTFTDINVSAELFDDEVLMFDTTSGNTVVLNSDLKFETPKAGLSSMIAIGNLSEPQYFDELELMKFNFLNSIIVDPEATDKKYQIKHLPDYGDPPKRYKALTVNMNDIIAKETDIRGSFIDPSQNYNTNNLVKGDYQNYLDKKKDLLEPGFWEKMFGKPSDETETDDVVNVEAELETEMPDGTPILYAKSNRDLKLLNAKKNNFISPKNNTISPVLPVNLTLKIYGNNFLGIGDFFTINFLPKHYQERVYFQIVGVDHSIGTSMWDTTYTTVMRLKPNEKQKTFSYNKNQNLPVVKLHPLYEEKTAEDMSKNQGGAQYDGKDVETTKLAVKGIRKDIEVIKTTAPNNDRANMSYDDIPSLSWARSFFIWDSENKKEKQKKAGIGKRSNKLINGVQIPETIDSGELAWWIAMTNALISDDFIDWSLLKDKGTPFSLFNTNKQADVVGRAKPGVFVSQRPFGDELIDNFDQPGASWGLDDFQESLLEKLSYYKDRQKVSQFLEEYLFFSKDLNLLYGIYWDVSTKTFLYNTNDQLEGVGVHFYEISVSGHSDTSIFPSFVIPSQLYKPQGLKDLANKVWTNYCTIKADLKVIFESDEREMDSIKTIADDPEAGFVG